MSDAIRLVLASASRARRHMLSAAGLKFECRPADIDEAAIRSVMQSESACVEAADVATTLAVEKALTVSRMDPSAVVIGADQVLALGMRLFDKAATLGEARQTLEILRGRTHELVSAAAVAKGGEIVWVGAETARLTMRPFSDEVLGSYLRDAGDRILGSVGCYEIEGPGIQLFEAIDGDYFTVLGLPLLPLLGELRRQGVLSA